ncbi:MAG: mcpA 1, partial [Firmicutes bacterium]|nr:mcpA 1 [Bacillota bacterium]
MGEEKYLAYAPIAGTPWSIGANVSVSEAKAQLRTFAWISIITIVVVLIVASFAILLTAARIAKPAGSIYDVSKGMDEQLTVANDTSAVVRQMSASIQQIAANISEVATQSTQAATKANVGNKSVDKAVSQMASIEQTVLNSAG